MPFYSYVNTEVEAVYLDGTKIEGVVRCNTDEGWLERNTGRITEDQEWETERLEGVVTVTFKTERNAET